MNVVGLVGAALEEVGSNRLRALLATVSILVGVATLALIVALGEIAQSTARSVVERETGRPATLEVSTEGSPSSFAALTLDLVESRLDRYDLTERSRLLTWLARNGAGTSGRPVALVGVDPELGEIRRFRVESGRFLVDEDDLLLAPVAVLNRAFASELERAASPVIGVGLQLRYGVEDISMRVVGVIDDGQDEARVYAPAEVLLRRSGTAGIGGASLVVHVEPFRAALVAERLAGDLRRLGVSGIQVLRIDEADAFASLFSLLQWVLAAIAGVSLVTGALGVLNLGIVTTRQRAKEFAIRRSFGATSRDVFFMVIAESMTTTTLGGVLGVVSAALLLLLLPVVIGDRVNPADLPPFPLNAALVGIVVSLLIGLLAGLLPARQATRVSIIETIRA